MNRIEDEYTDRIDLKYYQKHYLRNKEKLYKRHRKFITDRKFSNPEGYLCTRIRNRAKENNLEFNLLQEDINIPEFCPICNIPLYFSTGKRTDNTPSVDRIDNTKGYVKDNIKVISWRANKFKSNMSFEEIKNLYEYISTPI